MSQIKSLDISQWELLSKRSLSINRYSPDGKLVAKIYTDALVSTCDDLLRQLAIAQEVEKLGVPTPHVEDVIQTDEGPALLFQRVHNKQSLGRMIAEDPSTLPQAMHIYAEQMHSLHSTPCNTQFFSSRKQRMQQWAATSAAIDEADRPQIVQAINSLEDADTCLIIDAHPGNIIKGDEGIFFIDLGCFGWGSPYIDAADFYDVCHFMNEETAIQLIHLDRTLLGKCWEAFCFEYFGTETAQDRKELEMRLEPYAFTVPCMLEELGGHTIQALNAAVKETLRRMNE